MSSLAAVDTVAPDGDRPEPRYGRWRLTFGVVGRVWLWFLVGSLLVTFVPVLFGWRPYLITSGSMTPRIKVGDVVLSSPEQDPQKLLGHVISFNDPAQPGKVKSHRAIKINKDGTLQTKGDANPAPDTDPVQISEVRGIGRLLVRWVGLPLIWLQTGQWLLLLLFLSSLVVACLAVANDHEEDEITGEDDDGDDPTPLDIPPSAPSTEVETPTQIAATKPFTLRVRADRLLTPFMTKVVTRAGVVAVLSGLLVLPTTLAAFAATSKNVGNAWTVPKYVYTTEVINRTPYLYWKLDETGTTNTTAADASGLGHTGQYNGNLLPNASATYFTRGVGGAFVIDTPDTGVTLNNANSCINTTSATLITAPTTVTVIIWFKAPTTYNTGGKLAGFEKPRVGVAAPSTGTYDRMLYMDGNGKVWFGVYNGAYVTLGSTANLNDGNWHMAVGTVGATGTRLYIDGVLNASNATNTAAEATTGLWRAGCGNLAGWGGSWGGGNNPTTDSTVVQNRPFQGSLDEFTVLNSQMTAADISFLYWIR